MTPFFGGVERYGNLTVRINSTGYGAKVAYRKAVGHDRPRLADCTRPPESKKAVIRLSRIKRPYDRYYAMRFKFRSALKFLTRHPLPCPGNELCFPVSCGQARVGPRTDFLSACRSESLWFAAWCTPHKLMSRDPNAKVSLQHLLSATRGRSPSSM